MIQPTLWEDEKGLHMLVRTGVGSIYKSDSKDGGKTWCKAYDTGMPNPNSGIDVVKLHNGILVLIMNPVSENWGDRAPLVLMYSEDSGNTEYPLPAKKRNNDRGNEVNRDSSERGAVGNYYRSFLVVFLG